ncbi:cobalt transporter CbiM [Laspinema olomoucense]|uniref:Cobalt transporter CbiM n=1 Tax=Laspinema olomoucense D3b TaxID=2953688 RepID=A0ABT2NEP9_9CYAN|nr:MULTISPECIES: cobalt transporter CbiM [unclassified Laspinema]MCT7974993.1 cobalt transporter CbiM [Laspinema sp. D3d]MCT7980205.1 cobalt transporter CbiM [Laspinema sp. D3b]MCT7988350.1 cobalt transporter CbiM [Laspinema sp. D3a]MCT7996663.1 cobalt transporter CbiM [Laspinema sp. D3c]
MHIPDGILPASLCIASYGATGAATWYSLRQINRDRNPHAQIPKASLLTAAFFVASWIHIPVPPVSVHLILNGLLGTVLGYYAFPAILIGLFFQAIMFGHGGLTTLGVNAIMMGIPALIAYQIFQMRHWFKHRWENITLSLFAFLAGGIGLGLAAAIFFILIITTIPGELDVTTERNAIYGLMLAHIPLMLIEGLFTAMLVIFLNRVKPELISN